MNYLSVVSRCFVERKGGAPRVAWDVCKIMRDRGHKVTMFCHKEYPQADEVSEIDRIKVVRFEFPKTASLDPLKLQKQTHSGMTVARKYLLDTRWDIIHIHMPVEGRIVFKLIGKGPRYVYTVHSPSVMEQQFNWSHQGIRGRVKKLLGTAPLRRIEGTLLRNADCIQALSEFTKAAIEKFHGIGFKTRVIPHWCREDFVREHSKEQARARLLWPQDAKIIFTIRHFRPRYGLDTAIRAAAPLLGEHPNLRFILGGCGPLLDSMKLLAKRLGVDDKLSFLGRLSDDTLRLCYEAADLFVLPTRALECFGLIVLEAYAYGLPIISTDAGSLPELIGPLAPDMLVRAGSVDDLREKIKAFLNGSLNPPTSEKIIDYVRSRYSFEAVVPRIVQMLEGAG